MYYLLYLPYHLIIEIKLFLFLFLSAAHSVATNSAGHKHCCYCCVTSYHSYYFLPFLTPCYRLLPFVTVCYRLLPFVTVSYRFLSCLIVFYRYRFLQCLTVSYIQFHFELFPSMTYQSRYLWKSNNNEEHDHYDKHHSQTNTAKSTRKWVTITPEKSISYDIAHRVCKRGSTTELFLKQIIMFVTIL